MINYSFHVRQKRLKAAPAKVDDFLAQRMRPDCQVMIDRRRHSEEVRAMYHERKRERE